MDDYFQILDLNKPSAFKAADTVPSNALFDKYKIAELNGYVRKEFDKVQGLVKESAKKTAVFSWLMWLGWLIFLFLGWIILKARGNVQSFAQIYENSPIYFWVFFAWFVLTVAVTVWYMREKGKYKTLILAERTELDQSISVQFNIPAAAVKIDCFQRIYNDRRPCPPYPMRTCTSLRVYQKEEYIYLVLRQFLLRIPKGACISTQMVSDRILYKDPLLTVNIQSPEVRAFGIESNKGRYSPAPFRANQHGRLLFQSGSELWTLDVLPYHFENAEKLFTK